VEMPFPNRDHGTTLSMGSPEASLYDFCLEVFSLQSYEWSGSIYWNVSCFCSVSRKGSGAVVRQCVRLLTN